MKLSLLSAIITILLISPVFSQKIAVVKSNADNIASKLSLLKIPYEKLDFKELENLKNITTYDVIFFPSGMEPTIESSLQVQARRYGIKSVSIKKSYYEYNRKLITRNIQTFIQNGGIAYFSGYSYTYLQNMYNLFTFHDKFPPMGLTGKVSFKLHKNFFIFNNSRDLNLYFSYSGWIAPAAISKSTVLATGTYETPRGSKTGPMLFYFKPINSYIYYSAFHSSSFSPIERYIIYQTTGLKELEQLKSKASRWGQKIAIGLVDAILNYENFREYKVEILPGENTIHLNAKSNQFQIDIFESNFKLIKSIDNISKKITIKFNSTKKQLCRIRIYPDGRQRLTKYALLVASGGSILPYFSIIKIFLIVFAAAFIIYVCYRLITGNKVFEYK